MIAPQSPKKPITHFKNKSNAFCLLVLTLVAIASVKFHFDSF